MMVFSGFQQTLSMEQKLFVFHLTVISLRSQRMGLDYEQQHLHVAFV